MRLSRQSGALSERSQGIKRYNGPTSQRNHPQTQPHSRPQPLSHSRPQPRPPLLLPIEHFPRAVDSLSQFQTSRADHRLLMDTFGRKKNGMTERSSIGLEEGNFILKELTAPLKVLPCSIDRTTVCSDSHRDLNSNSKVKRDGMEDLTTSSRESQSIPKVLPVRSDGRLMHHLYCENNQILKSRREEYQNKEWSEVGLAVYRVGVGMYHSSKNLKMK